MPNARCAPRSPSSARSLNSTRENAGSGRAGARRAHRARSRAGRGGGGRRSLRRRAQYRRARAGAGRAGRGAGHRERSASGRRAVRRRGSRRACAQRRARADDALSRSCARAAAGASAPGALTPLVGREEELDLLAPALGAGGAGRGPARARWSANPASASRGSSRSFRLKLGETPHTWVEWSSSQLLQNTPLHPIAEWGRQRFGADAARRAAPRRPREHAAADRPRPRRICASARAAGGHPAAARTARRSSRRRNCAAGNWRR